MLSTEPKLGSHNRVSADCVFSVAFVVGSLSTLHRSPKTAACGKSCEVVSSVECLR